MGRISHFLVWWEVKGKGKTDQVAIGNHVRNKFRVLIVCFCTVCLTKSDEIPSVIENFIKNKKTRRKKSICVPVEAAPAFVLLSTLDTPAWQFSGKQPANTSNWTKHP